MGKRAKTERRDGYEEGMLVRERSVKTETMRSRGRENKL